MMTRSRQVRPALTVGANAIQRNVAQIGKCPPWSIKNPLGLMHRRYAHAINALIGFAPPAEAGAKV